MRINICIALIRYSALQHFYRVINIHVVCTAGLSFFLLSAVYSHVYKLLAIKLCTRNSCIYNMAVSFISFLFCVTIGIVLPYAGRRERKIQFK